MNQNLLHLIKQSCIVAAIVVMGLFCLSQVSLIVDDWPQWRGADQTGVSSETNLGDGWTEENLLWRFELPGPGGASPIVFGHRIFVSTVDGEGADGDPLALVCISTDGEQLWQQPLEGPNKNSRDGGTGASPSPATDGEHVWAMGTAGILHCFTVEGELVWTKDVQAEYGEFKIQFGMTSTPALDNGRLYLQLIHGELSPNSEETSKGWVVALDSKSGEEIWRHLRETDGTFENMHSYASPVIYRDELREFLITHGGDYAIGHSLEDGSEIWRCGGFNPKENYNQMLRFVSSPVCGNKMIVLPSAKQGPVIAIRPDGVGDITGDEEFVLWKVDQVTPDVSCPLIVDNIVYLTHQSGILTLVAAQEFDVEAGEDDATITFEAGDVIYRDRSWFADLHRSSPVVSEDRIFVAGRDGTLTIIKAGVEPEIAARIELGEDMTASPAISGGKVFIRTIDALYAFGEIESDSK